MLEKAREDAHSLEKQRQKDLQPNFIFLFPDDLGYNDVNYSSGLGPLNTQNIDMLAMDGVRLTNYYSGPICTPARCALMTGRYMMRSGCHYNAGRNNSWSLNLNEILVPEVLMSGGYYSVLYGKWHLGFHSWEHMPTMRGFDEFRGFLGDVIGQESHMDQDVYDWWNGTAVDTSAYNKYSTYLIKSYMYDLIDRSVSGSLRKPFFAYLPLAVPSEALSAPKEYTRLLEKEWGKDTDLTLWLSELLMLDDLVGSLWQYLSDVGLLWNTYLIFAGNHGAPKDLPYNLAVSRNYPFSGEMGTLWEGGVRSPAWIYNPRIPSLTLDTPTSVIDWLPTLAELGGIPNTNVPSNIDGISLVNLWTYGEKENYWRMLLIDVDPDCQSRLSSKGDGNDKDVQNLSAAIRYGPYKLLSTCVDYNGIYTDQYLYNIIDDPGETTNLLNKEFNNQLQNIYNLMAEALSTLAQEAYPTEPHWNEGVFSPGLDQSCGYGTLWDFEVLFPYSTCSKYYIGNPFENYSWACIPYCTEAFGGIMPSSGIRSNRLVRKTVGNTLSTTQGPSLAPTQYLKDPTVTLSADATETPTPSPLREPTGKPSVVPFYSPSRYPTFTGSPNPTHLPTIGPTLLPSSLSPSAHPTKNPSIDPTDSPSRTPTRRPSLHPSRSPSVHPTFSPSARPTYIPTRDPTQAPSTVPTEKRVSSMKIYTRVFLPLVITLFAAFLLVWSFVKKRNQVLKHYKEINKGTISTDYESSASNVSLMRRNRDDVDGKLSYQNRAKKKIKHKSNRRSNYVSLMDAIGSGYGSVSSP